MKIRRLINIIIFLVCLVSFRFLYGKQLGAISYLLMSFLFFNVAYYEWKQKRKDVVHYENKDKD